MSRKDELAGRAGALTGRSTADGAARAEQQNASEAQAKANAALAAIAAAEAVQTQAGEDAELGEFSLPEVPGSAKDRLDRFDRLLDAELSRTVRVKARYDMVLGHVLQAVNDSGDWKEAGHDSFEAYAKVRGVALSRAYELMTAAPVLQIMLSAIAEFPTMRPAVLHGKALRSIFDSDGESGVLTALRLLEERGEKVTVPALALVCAEIEGSDVPAARSVKPSRSVPSALAKVHRRAEAARKAVESLDIEALSKLTPEADNVFEEIAAGYEEAAKRLRAVKKQAATQRKKREKSSTTAQGRKPPRTLDEALSIPSQERAYDAKEDAAAG
ncbi:hypothetical protein [Streptomyces sp. Isolate_45]|uniref:hypothetical protein n=1 Tax=Streptomyces sp. Isolate_45 TaxID=2950111 RepID=UPI002481E5BE|nr:hypothetical protein [Streptomyces sp. Isolate_45]MDA5283685.1 hypothetical protein [Streptomyces sp. Isolate_45]